MNTQNTTKTQTKNMRNLLKTDIKFQEFCMIRGIKDSSAHAYLSPLSIYLRLNDATLSDLIEEADEEEEQNIRIKKRKLKQRLLYFKQYLQTHGYKNSTINSYMTQLTTIYRTFEITVPGIPKSKVRKPSYKDIIQKEDIAQALEMCTNKKHKAIILFMCSSGTGVGETCNLTIQDFIDATSEYHNEIRIENVVQSLKHREDVIPTWHIRRVKTGVPYFTFSSPESVKAIIQYLQERILLQPVSPDEKLFSIVPKSVAIFFGRLNDRCGFNWVNDTHRYFHSHGLRKFFATNMLSVGVSELVIDFWEGRTVQGTHSAYFNPSPEQLKKRYMNAMNCVTIFSDVTYHDITSEEKLELERLRELEEDRDRKIQHLQDMVDKFLVNRD